MILFFTIFRLFQHLLFLHLSLCIFLLFYVFHQLILSFFIYIFSVSFSSFACTNSLLSYCHRLFHSLRFLYVLTLEIARLHSQRYRKYSWNQGHAPIFMIFPLRQEVEISSCKYVLCYKGAQAGIIIQFMFLYSVRATRGCVYNTTRFVFLVDVKGFPLGNPSVDQGGDRGRWSAAGTCITMDEERVVRR
jgi:hypothetical protein